MKINSAGNFFRQFKESFSHWRVVCFCFLFSVSACSFFSVRHFPVSSNTSEIQTQVAQQQWQLTYANEHYSLQVIVERTPTHWQWIMLNSLGQRLATATVTGNVIHIEQQQSHPANVLIPQFLEAVQLSYWPLADLEKINSVGWKFQQHATHRDIYFSDILHATVDYENASDNAQANAWQNNLRYENKKSHFQIIIQSQLLN